MCPSQISPKPVGLYAGQMPAGHPKQRGFLLPLAIFILVVMASFALVLSRNTIQSGGAAVQEVTSVQAFYAAESGAQVGMQALFYPDASSRQAVDSRCLALNSTTNYTSPGLNGCTAAVSCSCLYADNATYASNTVCSPGTAANYSSTAPANHLTSFYTITSVGTCGSGNFRAVRTIEAGSFLKQE